MTQSAAIDPSPANNCLLADWPLRPWILAAIGGIAGLGVYELLDGFTAEPWRAALAALLFFGAVAAGFVLRPQNLFETAGFALGIGAVMGGIAYIAVDTGDSRAGEEFAFAAGVFFSILAIPLFQADFHRKRWATPYAETHFHVWTDAVSAGGAFLFMLLSWALLWLLHGLFSLIGIEVIEELIDTGWFSAMFAGATFGAALGVLRNQLGIIGTLQRVVMLVFALLAVPFALAILLFLVILIFSGGGALWDATDSATPLLLTCAVGCFILTNAVVRDDDEHRSGNAVMQAAALVLAVCILPLTVFAAISMGIRIDQYGLAPERIWALIAIVISTAYGIAYWAGLARGRLGAWSDYLRRANLHLAVATCGVALFLALPILDFGGISAKNQVARLDAGKVSADDFDFNALRWDFGDAGRDALAVLAEGEGEVAELAQVARDDTEQYENIGRSEQMGEVVFDFEDALLREWVEQYLAENPWSCRTNCVALDLGTDSDRRHVALVSERQVTQLYFRGDGVVYPPEAPAAPPSIGETLTPDEVEIREYTGRQVYVGGEPVGNPFP